ncbi:MAG: transposase [Streptosporangiaceae bacterium]
MLGVVNIPHHEEETAVLHTLPRPGPGPQTLPVAGPALPPVPDLAVFTSAVARYRALEKLREFRSRLYDCLALRADALFELADAVLCADHAVTSLVQLSLEPEFTRGHGALYDALSAGRADDERLFSLLAAELPQAVDGPEARAWIAEHDVIDHGLLEKALAGLPPDDAAQVRDACARWARLRFAVDATAYPRPDAWCSPGREHVHNGACHCKGSSKTAPGWEYQFTAAVGHLRTAWAALLDVARTVPATRTAQTIAQVRSVLRRLRAAGHGRQAAPLFIFDAGYSAAALTGGLLGCPVHVLVRLAAGSVFYYDALRWPGKNGRPGDRGLPVHCLEPDDFAAAEGAGLRGRKRPLPPNPEPDEELALPGTPLYGTVRAEAFRGVHPLIHADRGWFRDRRNVPVLRGTLVHVTVERLPDGRDPHRAMWLWHAGPGPLSLDELWRAYLARFDIEHAFKLLKGALGLTAAKVRAPEQADRWIRLLMTAHAQLLLARPLAGGLRRPWEKQPDPARPLAPGRVRRGFRNIRRDLGTPARVAKPTRPGPGRPKGSSKGPAPRYLLPGEADMPRTAKPALTREKVKT